VREVAVIGGGPGGATAAALLAAAGRDVLLIERERFPRFHIGESLLPWNMAIFERLGVVEELERRFLKKWGVEFLSTDGENRSQFYFEEALDPRYPVSFQVTRAEFDDVLLKRAAELGAGVRQGARAARADEEKDGSWRLALEADGSATEERARFLVDATGRDGFLAARHGMRKMDPSMKKASVFAHYRGVPRRPGRDEGNLIIVLLSDGWFWIIPLAGGVTSVGLVTDGASIKRLKLDPKTALDRAAAACPVVREMLARAERVSDVHAASDWTYECGRLAGDNFLILGDSAAFVDPIFSSGVLLAMKSGEMAADLIDAAFRAGDLARSRFATYERDVIRHARSYYRMVRSFYDSGFPRMSFSNQKENSVYRAVLNFLAGDMTPAWPIRWRLEVFYFLASMARRLNLGPKLNLAPAFGAPGGAP